jgi:hypothetical protein
MTPYQGRSRKADVLQEPEWVDALPLAPADEAPPKRRSRLGTPLIIVACLVILAGAMLAVVLFGNRIAYGKRIELEHGNELYYTSTVTTDEAQRLADFLNDKIVTPEWKATFQLRKAGEVYELRLVVKEGAEKDEAKILSFRALGVLVSAEVFNQAPVEVHLCDQNLKTIKVLPAGK